MYTDVQMPQETWMPGVASEAISLWNQSVGDCFVTAFLAMTSRSEAISTIYQIASLAAFPSVSLSWCATSGHSTAETNSYQKA
jgi:sugar/nucleoside kinase (ribokinase family)